MAYYNGKKVLFAGLGSHIMSYQDRKSMAEDVKNKVFELAGVRPSNNLLDVKTKRTGYVGKDGTIYNKDEEGSSTTYEDHVYFTQYIHVEKNDTVTIQFTSKSDGVRYSLSEGNEALKNVFMRIVCAYDDQKIAVTEKSASKATSYTVPEGVSYIRITLHKGMLEDYDDLALVVNADSVLAYEPYGLIPLPKTVNAFLPKEICCAVGRTIEIYNSQVCLQSDKYHMRWNCEVGKAMKRKFSITGTDDNVGEYRLTLYVLDDDRRTVWAGSTTLKIVPQLSTTKSVVCIGDSLTNGKAWLKELLTLSDGHIVLNGTRGDTHKHEGRSGWSAERYTRAGDKNPSEDSYTYENPFYNDGFNWHHYVTNSLDGVAPDGVVVYLGTNGIALDPTNNANAIKTIIDSIVNAADGTTIYVVFTLYRANQNGLGVQANSDGYTAANSGKYKYEEDLKVFNLMTRLYSLLKDYDNLYFVPISLCHDSEYNFGAVETPVNPRAVQKEYLPEEATHPQDQGYRQMADILYSTICAH